MTISSLPEHTLHGAWPVPAHQKISYIVHDQFQLAGMNPAWCILISGLSEQPLYDT